jgi:hypothetical protein
MGRLTTVVIACGVGPSDVPARPAFANSVILAAGPRILEARSRTKNSLVIQAEIASLGCRHTAGNDDGGYWIVVSSVAGTSWPGLGP